MQPSAQQFGGLKVARGQRKIKSYSFPFCSQLERLRRSLNCGCVACLPRSMNMGSLCTHEARARITQSRLR
eukprot:5470121-Pleurochrysis_carterae.AAC.1